jgi:hypothetical protein
MSEVTWLVELDDDFPGPERLLQGHLRGHGARVILLDPGPPWAPRWPEVEGPVVAYGTMRTLRRLQQHQSLSRSVFDDYPSLRCSVYYRHVYDLLGRDAVLVPLAALAHLDLARRFGERVFVRPETNYKLFPAQIVESAGARAFVDLQREHATELVVLSEVVDLGEEFRCFCRDGVVFAHSSYPFEPWGPAPLDVQRFAREVAARLRGVTPSDMITVDVARASDGRLRLVEVGGVNSWGVYGADLADFVAAMEAEAREVWDEQQGSGEAAILG